MKYSTLIAEVKPEQGRGASRRLRRSGRVPAIIYGSEMDAVAVSLDHNTVFYALQKEAFHTSILNIELGDKVEKVLLRDFQMHSYRPQVLHLDFQRVNDKEEIQIRVPLHFTNEEIAYAVKVQGARITHVANEVEIRAFPKDIPHFIEVDLKDLKAGQSVHLSDLVLPEGVKLVNLLRGDDAAVVIAAGVTEDSTETEVVAAADIPTSGRKSEA